MKEEKERKGRAVFCLCWGGEKGNCREGVLLFLSFNGRVKVVGRREGRGRNGRAVFFGLCWGEGEEEFRGEENGNGKECQLLMEGYRGREDMRGRDGREEPSLYPCW